ncbi:transcription antiterminator BglG [Lacticaseibacillus chiayiensis]|uniref:Ascorbate-specific PTS system EIIA component n=1 Tax=Lacticaseibacillus chiayiensis TaxID=2100821 RepID=A0A4Q1U227_9LACO|nr:BglG family transcription antiterminator [Lacticaseibacillus chiayiensis]QVI35078.1 BglG family transcription antiterminator [Lacticaseibacillus chiayiensis]RXT24715.1 transcription antiterminator BglG [Lacticaseibacillus chiayiensis]UYN56860.1 BglG family transcription antiterminator [Lacticaseibacillus chiayiensis]
MLDTNQLQVIDTMIQNPILTKTRLSEQLKLTNRQIDYAIEKINQQLKDHAVPRIDVDGAYINVPSKAYQYLLRLRASENLTAPSNYVLSSKERQLFLALLLACHNGYLSLVHLQDYLKVSQSTISKDLRTLERRLLSYQLRIHYDRRAGYRLEGSENKIRGFVIRLVSKELFKNHADLLTTCAKIIQHVNVSEKLDKISQEARSNKIDFVENRFLEFGYIFIFIIARLRIKNDYLPARARKFNIQGTQEFLLSETLLSEEGVHSITASEYLTTIILCLSVGGLENMRADRNIFSVTSEFVQKFSDISGIVFSDQHKVIRQMFTHFRSMYYRLEFNYPITNPLTEQVINNYQEVFSLVARAIHSFRDILGEVPDDEIAFLTIHLISFIYTGDSSKNDSITAAIVCPNGIGNSALAYLQLTSLFPNIKFLKPFRYADLDRYLDSVDMIFSTFYRSDLFTKGKPCFIIKPIMSTEGKYNLIQEVNTRMSSSTLTIPTLNSVMKIVAKTIKNDKQLAQIRRELDANLFKPKVRQRTHKLALVDVLREDDIKLGVEADSAKEAIRIAAKPLVDQGAINQNYVEKMVSPDAHALSAYIISPGVALPHSNPENGAKRVAIGMTVLKTPIAFGKMEDGKVRFIFVLSAVNPTDHLMVLQDLMDLLADSRFMDLLISQKTDAQDVLRYLREKSKLKMKS